jgi:hypothetical protein
MEDQELWRKRLYDGATKTEDGCLIKGNEYAYRNIVIDGRTKAAHRLAYELEHGPIPKGLVVMHKCDVPGCFNPEHLSVGTQSDNAVDMHNKNRAYKTSGRSPQKQNVKTVPFLVRMRPEIRELLEAASSDQRRSMASIIDQAVRDQLEPRYGQLNDRLSRLIGGK